ncbi:MAG: TIM barrel protein [Chloroflexota bacterium]|nr:TIM barrel protein [Chloroflexota bacterium]
MTIPDRVAANVAWLFTEHAWPDRFAAAAASGFAAVEFPWPDDPAATVEAVRGAGLRVAMLNMAAGNLAAGDRGCPNDPARMSEWRQAFADALHLAIDLQCPTINVLAGNLLANRPIGDQLACFETNLRWALPAAAGVGVTIVSELLNRRENPAYLLVDLGDAEPLLERMGPLGWRLQLDTYHVGLTGADVPAAIRRAAARIGHVQVADVPGRHEPGTGALDWNAIGSALTVANYEGAIGLEYRPSAGFGWIDEISLSG